MDRTTASRQIRGFLQAREGVSALEYAILVGIVTVGIGAAVATFSQEIQDVIADIGTTMEDNVDQAIEDAPDTATGG